MASENGKVVKRESKLHDSLEVKPFPWLHFQDKDLVFPDNARKSIVLSRFHEEDEIRAGIISPPQFSKKLQAPITPLFPVDLTKDYLASQEEMMVRKRRRLLDEDEAMALELADLVSGRSVNDAKWRGEEANEEGAVEATPSSLEEPLNNTQSMNGGEHLSPPEGTPQNVSAALPQQGKTPEGEVHGVTAPLAPPTMGVAPPGPSTAQGLGTPLSTTKGETPTKAAPPSPDPILVETARQAAYEEGYKAAQEAHAQDVEKIELDYGVRFQEALEKLSQLKKDSLESGKDIFVDILKLSAKSVLMKELSTSDEALKNLFLKVLDGLSKADTFKIEMHPEDQKRLIGLNLSEINLPHITITENSNLRQGDFKIEANNETYKFELQKLIDSFIEQLKDDLFKKDMPHNGEEP